MVLREIGERLFLVWGIIVVMLGHFWGSFVLRRGEGGEDSETMGCV
jgi:hypothetical protein